MREWRKPLYVGAIDISKEFYPILHSQAVLGLLRCSVNPFICASLWQWYQNSSMRVHVENLYSSRISVHHGAKQGLVLSSAIFNNTIRCATCTIPHFLIEPSIDASHLSCADDILLLSDNFRPLQAAVNSLYAGLSDTELAVTSAKTEFLVFGFHHPPDLKNSGWPWFNFCHCVSQVPQNSIRDLDSCNKVTKNKCVERKVEKVLWTFS